VKIHPTAVVSPQADLAHDVEIGPLCVVEAGTVIGLGTHLASHVVLKRGTTLGADNQILDGAVLGGLPQHTSLPEQLGTLVVGDSNVVRENATLHRSLRAGECTRVGHHNLLMVGCHVGHDCVIGDHVVLTNNVMLGGHVEVGDRAYLGGGAAAHQFVRIGGLAMVGGYARVIRDVPPFFLLDGDTGMVVGLNRIGLSRAGLSSDAVKQLKAAYRVVYRQGLTWNEVQTTLGDRFGDGPAAELARFLTGGTRGFAQERRIPPGATIRIHDSHQDTLPHEDQADFRAEAG